MVSDEQIQQIAQRVKNQPISEATVTQLRETFPELHFTYCMDDDVVSARPVLEDSEFNLYLIDSRQHCLNFTQDKEHASGVVLAEIEPD